MKLCMCVGGGREGGMGMLGVTGGSFCSQAFSTSSSCDRDGLGMRVERET